MVQPKRIILTFGGGALVVHTLYRSEEFGPNPGTKARLRYGYGSHPQRLAGCPRSSRQQILKERDAEIASIRAKVEWTEEAKNERIAAVHEWANTAYAEAKEAERRGREERLRSAQRAVFGVVDDASATAAERAQIHAAYRHAVGEVKWAAMESGPSGTTEGLLDLLDRAERSGDTLMAKAVFHYGVDNGLQPIVDRYLEDGPEENRRWERYTKAVEEDRAAKDVTALLNSALVGRALSDGVQ